MSISLEQVKHIALLARLDFANEELVKFTRQINEILQYAEKISELETSRVAPTSHAIPMSNVFREDQVRQSLSVQQALKNAPRHDGSTFIVPKVTEG